VRGVENAIESQDGGAQIPKKKGSKPHPSDRVTDLKTLRRGDDQKTSKRGPLLGTGWLKGRGNPRRGKHVVKEDVSASLLGKTKRCKPTLGCRGGKKITVLTNDPALTGVNFDPGRKRLKNNKGKREISKTKKKRFPNVKRVRELTSKRDQGNEEVQREPRVC